MGTKRGTGRGGFIDSVLAAIDGFYGAVVQQLRPWSAKAPQLPKGGKTAAEEAGIDIEPQPGDIDEPGGPEVTGDVPRESEAPEVIDEGVATGAATAEDDSNDPAASEPVPDELVAWVEGQERIEHQRES